MSRETKNVLFLCFGNICRSPFAEGLFAKLAAQAEQKDLWADSAGLFALPGNSATSLAQRVAIEHDVDLSKHEAKPVSKTLVKWSDLILVMEKSHTNTLLETFPEATDKTRLIRQFSRVGSKHRGIADPYGLQYEAYRFCFLDIEDAVSGLITTLSDERIDDSERNDY